MGERGARELPRGYFRLQARLHVGEIGGVSPDAAEPLTAFGDSILPQSALERSRGVIERQAEVRESRCGGGRGRRGNGICDGGRGRAGIHLVTVSSVMVMKIVCDA